MEIATLFCRVSPYTKRPHLVIRAVDRGALTNSAVVATGSSQSRRNLTAGSPVRVLAIPRRAGRRSAAIATASSAVERSTTRPHALSTEVVYALAQRSCLRHDPCVSLPSLIDRTGAERTNGNRQYQETALPSPAFRPALRSSRGEGTLLRRP